MYALQPMAVLVINLTVLQMFPRYCAILSSLRWLIQGKQADLVFCFYFSIFTRVLFTVLSFHEICSSVHALNTVQ